MTSRLIRLTLHETWRIARRGLLLLARYILVKLLEKVLFALYGNNRPECAEPVNQDIQDTPDEAQEIARTPLIMRIETNAAC